MAPLADIEDILADVRIALDNNNFLPVPRRKNIKTLSMLGLSWEDAKAEVYDLTANNYFQGPEVDRDCPHTDPFWMFKKSIDGQIIYIKFKVLYSTDILVKLVSFHLDEP